jgi:hypothetical protein
LVPAVIMRGAIGSTYRIEYASQGPNERWHTLDTVTLTNEQQFYFDASAIGQLARVYRLV